MVRKSSSISPGAVTAALRALCVACLAWAAHAGLDANGQNWGVLSATREELGIPPPYDPNSCVSVDPHCSICQDNICHGCGFPFEVNEEYKCVCSKGYTLADDGSSCVDDTAVAIGKGIYNNPLVQQAGNATQVAVKGAGKSAEQAAVQANQNTASFLQQQAQQLLGPNVKLPKAPDPLQSFLAAVGAPAMQPTEDSAPAPAEAPGAAMPAMGSMPNILAQAPAAANLLAANPVQNFISELLATPPAAQPELPAAETPAAAQTPAAASGMPDPLAALFAATTPVAQPTVTQPQPAAQTPAAAATPAAAGGVPQLLSALFATTPAAQPAARASAAQAPAAPLQPISSLLDQGQALLPSWLPNWGSRRMLRAGEDA